MVTDFVLPVVEEVADDQHRGALSRGIQLPSWGSADTTISNSPLGPSSTRRSSALDVEAIPAMTCRPTYLAVPRFPHNR